MLKKVMSLGLAAYLAFSPINLNAKDDTEVIDHDKTRYVSLTYGNARIHTFLASLKEHSVRIGSSVGPDVEDSSENQTFEPKGETLERIVSDHESSTSDNVLAAINGSYFDPPSFHIVGREKIDGVLIKRKSKPKKIKEENVSKGEWIPKPGYPDFKNRASFFVGEDGVPKIGYFDDISDADYFLTAGPMLVYESKDVWEQAYENENFDSTYLKPYRRSVVAITKKGNLMLATTEEMTLDKLTEFLMRIKVQSAMCLDSGSSVQMVLDKVYTGKEKENSLIYGTQRKIVNSILVVE